MILLEKPKYKQPCNNCGQCCMLQLCPIAMISYGENHEPPCPAIIFDGDRALCNMVLTEKLLGVDLIAKSLGIGCGCSMPDKDTTEEEITAFDEQSYHEVYG